MDKYDEAITFLQGLDEQQGGGSYYAEVAALIEELLGRIHELDPPPPEPVTPRAAAYREQQRRIGAGLSARARAWREKEGLLPAQSPSPASDDAE